MQRAIFIGALMTYLLGYGAMRYEHFLIHSISLSGPSEGLGPSVEGHEIRPGEEEGSTPGPATSLAAMIARVIYWPLCKAELLYWYLAEPPGTPYRGEALSPLDAHAPKAL